MNDKTVAKDEAKDEVKDETMDVTEDQDAGAPAADLRGNLLRYRVLAYLTGVALLGLLAALVLKYAFDSPGMMGWIGVTHGILYMIYLVVGVDLALKARWSMKGTVLVLLAGTLPFLSFVAERKVTHRVAQGRKL